MLLKYESRPHWGKMHWFHARDLSEVYPKWNEFLAVRERLDPNDIFLTEWKAEVFYFTTSSASSLLISWLIVLSMCLLFI
jgi:hypothetical protein